MNMTLWVVAVVRSVDGVDQNCLKWLSQWNQYIQIVRGGGEIEVPIRYRRCKKKYSRCRGSPDSRLGHNTTMSWVT